MKKELITGETVGRELPFETDARRAGDIASSYASPKKANEVLNWSATLSVHDAM
jgi:UDP-glucose 4-epimerase